jgi:hypothetical protein
LATTFLSALPAVAVHSADCARHCGYHHRQPVDRHRRAFDDAVGHSARLVARLHIEQTSEKGYGQIYVGVVNWLLMIVTIALAVLSRKSANLAAAYGIAASLTMLMTSLFLFIAVREVLNWSLRRRAERVPTAAK